MFDSSNKFQTFAELDAALKHCVETLNRRGVASINGMIDVDITYTVNGVSGVACLLRTEEGWTYCTEL